MAGSSSKLDYLRRQLAAAEQATTLSGKQIALTALREAVAEIERLLSHVPDQQGWSEVYGRSGGGFVSSF